MSSPSDSSPEQRKIKRRKVQHACDHCRLKKIRCHSHPSGRIQCSNCITHNEECTYDGVAKKRHLSKDYIEFLENRVKRLESALNRSHGEASSSGQTSTRTSSRHSHYVTETRLQTPNRELVHHLSPRSESSSSPRTCENDETDQIDSSDDEELKELYLSLKTLELDPAFSRFYGRTANFKLLKGAVALQSQFSGRERPSLLDMLKNMQMRRPEFWCANPWEKRLTEPGSTAGGVQYSFPDDDLIPILVEHYFFESNSFLPVLHRPSFVRHVAARAYLVDANFARLFLVVCCIGAQFADDPRIRIDGANFSAGWKWYNQVHSTRPSPPNVQLHDMQLCALSTIFTWIASTPRASWSHVEAGIKCAQDVGAHRRGMYSVEPNLNDELWKRCIWVLIIMDRTACLHLGRPCVIQDEDFDIDLPMLVDDEYWEEPAHFAKTPTPFEHGPCTLGAFVCSAQLTRMLAFALRTIYSVNKPQMLHGFLGPEWEQKVTEELSSALNKWYDSVPDYLRWDPTCQNELVFHQATNLHLAYHQVRIAVHRPFLPDVTRRFAQSSSALAVCSSAARSTARIMNAHFKRRQQPLPFYTHALRPGALIIVMDARSNMRTGASNDPQKTLVDVAQSIQYLKHCSARWQVAGRAWQTLSEVVSVGVGDAQPSSSQRGSPNENLSADGRSLHSLVPPVQNPGIDFGPSSALEGEFQHHLGQMNGSLEFGGYASDLEHPNITPTSLQGWMPYQAGDEGMWAIQAHATTEWATNPVDVFEDIFGAEWLGTAPHLGEPTPTNWDESFGMFMTGGGGHV